MDYKGYLELTLAEDELANFYNDKTPYIELLRENQYLLIKDSTGEVVDKFCR